ncbi:MAG: hypothetical protein O3B13_03610 [Planctomycetota bacterium]|nr:hypothetical protein [Planctomycetota bacterium]
MTPTFVEFTQTTATSPEYSSPATIESDSSSVVPGSGQVIVNRFIIEGSSQTEDTRQFSDPRIDELVSAIDSLREKLGLQADATSSLSDSVDAISGRLDEILKTASSKEPEKAPATNVLNVTISGLSGGKNSQAVGKLLGNIASGVNSVKVVEKRDSLDFGQLLTPSRSQDQVLSFSEPGSTFGALA